MKTKINLIKLFLFMFMLCSIFIIMPTDVSAIAYDESYYTFTYDFEQGSGAVVQDNSENNYDGTILAIDRYAYITPAYHGDYSLDFLNLNRLGTALQYPQSFKMTNHAEIHFSAYIGLNVPANARMFQFYDSGNEAEITLKYVDNDTLNLVFHKGGYVYPAVTFDVPYNMKGEWHTYFLEFDFENWFIRARMDGDNTILASLNCTGILLPSGEFYTYLAGDVTGQTARMMPAIVDTYGFFNQIMTDEQRYNLHTYGSLNVPVPDIANISSYAVYSPVNNNIYENLVSFSAGFMDKFNCEIYLNNKLFDSIFNISSFNQEYALEDGVYNTYFYCSRVEPIINETNSFKTDIINFQVYKKQAGRIDFYMTSKEFDMSEKNLYVVSPCLPSEMFNPNVDNKYYSDDSGNTYYIDKLISGYAKLNLTAGKQEICLVHANLFYNESPTTMININNAYNQLNLGTFNLPVNDSILQSYSLTNQDIYNFLDVKDSPQAFGTSWTIIITSVMAVVFGILLCVMGATLGVPQLTIIGGILIILGLGFTVPSLLFFAG